MPRQHRGNASIYGIVDQPLFGGGPDGFAGFARAMGAPWDRNLLAVYLDGGITYKSPANNLLGQTGDTTGIAVAYARIGAAARALAAQTAAFTGQPYPQRSSETVVELTYQIQLRPGWLVQPDLQYVINSAAFLIRSCRRAGSRMRSSAARVRSSTSKAARSCLARWCVGKSQVPPDDAVRVITAARQLSPAFGERMSKMWWLLKLEVLPSAIDEVARLPWLSEVRKRSGKTRKAPHSCFPEPSPGISIV
jgi:hypothetical protein